MLATTFYCNQLGFQATKTLDLAAHWSLHLFNGLTTKFMICPPLEDSLGFILQHLAQSQTKISK